MATPNTASYMIAGYAVIFILLAGYALSLVVRWKANLRKNRSRHQQERRDINI